MIESTTDISSEMNSMEAELEQNENLCLKSCCRLELMKHKNVPKLKFSNFQNVVCINCSKLEINSQHNLKDSLKYYTVLQSKRTRRCGVPPYTNNF